MLARILELWPTLPDAALRIGASHVSVLESAAKAAVAAARTSAASGSRPPRCKEIDPAEEPGRAALLLKARAEMRWYLGRAEGIDDVREALRLVPADAPDAAARRQVLSWLATWPEVAGTSRGARRGRGGAAVVPAGR